MNYQYLQIQDDKKVRTVTLNREDVHNAFNDELINELKDAFYKAKLEDSIQLVVLTGKGRSFCAGADLNWMKSMVNYSFEENKKDSENLASLFEMINLFPKPLIGKVNGAALGGGVGLVAVCDYVITHEKAKFGFTETRLGLIPAVISPYCINKIGESHARAWFLSGELFKADKAQAMGLVHQVSTLESFEEDFNKVVRSFLQAAPMAQREAKLLIKNVIDQKEQLRDFTCEAIAKRRISDEGQEGMSALLEKRQASWLKDSYEN